MKQQLVGSLCSEDSMVCSTCKQLFPQLPPVSCHSVSSPHLRNRKKPEIRGRRDTPRKSRTNVHTGGHMPSRGCLQFSFPAFPLPRQHLPFLLRMPIPNFSSPLLRVTLTAPSSGSPLGPSVESSRPGWTRGLRKWNDWLRGAPSICSRAWRQMWWALELESGHAGAMTGTTGATLHASHGGARKYWKWKESHPQGQKEATADTGALASQKRCQFGPGSPEEIHTPDRPGPRPRAAASGLGGWDSFWCS